MRSNSSGVSPCCLTSSGVTAGSTVGVWLVIDRCKVTNPQDRSITQIRIFIKSSHPGSVQHVFELRTLGVDINREASMVKKTIIALACVLIASPAFAQTTTKRTRYHRTTTALTTVEGVTVTAPIIGSQGGQRGQLSACRNTGHSHGRCESGAV